MKHNGDSKVRLVTSADGTPDPRRYNAPSETGKRATNLKFGNRV